MKRSNLIPALIFALVYAVVLSFGIECLFQCIGVIGTVGGIDSDVPSGYPVGMFWLSFIAGILSTALLIVILIFNYNVSDKLGYNKYIWWLQFIAAAVIAFFMVEPWEKLFVFLQETF